MTASFPADCIYKADQWCMLSRYHVEQILALRDAFDAEHLKLTNHSRGFTHMFTPGKATDELIIPCSLAILGHIRSRTGSAPNQSDQQQGKVLVRRSTYCDWSAREKRPRSFTPSVDYLIPVEHLKAARSEGCVFLRKIALPEGTREVSETMLKQWLSIVHNDSATVNERLQSALTQVEEFKTVDAALESTDVVHLARIFNNYERNDSSGESSGSRPQGGVGRWDSNRNHSYNNGSGHSNSSSSGGGEYKRKYEDKPRENHDQKRPYYNNHDYR